MKRLFLLRHGKAGFGETDPVRPLASRGAEDAHWLGVHLAQKALLPDRILCSSARRTRETLAHFRLGAQIPLEASFHDDLYLASSEHLLHQLHRLENTFEAAMIIGHNPGIAQLFLNLVTHPPTEQRLMQFPTCCLVVLDFDITNWQNILSNTGQLVYGVVSSDERKQATKKK